MKIKLLFILTFLCLSCKQTEFNPEEELFECFCEKGEQAGIDLRGELHKYENYLISIGLLDGSNGDEYYNLYQDLSKMDYEPPRKHNYSLTDSIAQNAKTGNMFYLRETCDSTLEELKANPEYKNSKLSKLEQAMKDLRNSDDLNPEKIGSTVLTILTPEDMEQEYYKMTVLLTLAVYP